MLYRLLLKAANNIEIRDIVVSAYSQEALQRLVEDPGGDGYKLTEVLSALFPDIKLLSAHIDAEMESCNSDDTLLQWKYVI